MQAGRLLHLTYAQHSKTYALSSSDACCTKVNVWNLLGRWVTMRIPDKPRVCPRLMAPPSWSCPRPVPWRTIRTEFVDFDPIHVIQGKVGPLPEKDRDCWLAPKGSYSTPHRVLWHSNPSGQTHQTLSSYDKNIKFVKLRIKFVKLGLGFPRPSSINLLRSLTNLMRSSTRCPPSTRPRTRPSSINLLRSRSSQRLCHTLRRSSQRVVGYFLS